METRIDQSLSYTGLISRKDGTNSISELWIRQIFRFYRDHEIKMQMKSNPGLHCHIVAIPFLRYLFRDENF